MPDHDLGMSSSKPYLVRAFYEWIVDNETTPYLVVNAEFPGVVVPRQYVEEGRIVLNIAPLAVKNLFMDNEAVTFGARFSGQSINVYVPTHAIMAIYAKENGRGMVFNEEEEEERETEARVHLDEQDEPHDLASVTSSGGRDEKGSSQKKGKPSLRVVK